MANATQEPPETKRGITRILVFLLATCLLGGLGFSSSYFDLWSPTNLFQRSGNSVETVAAVTFLDVPPVEIFIPGSGMRSIYLTASLDLRPEDVAKVQELMPRVQNAMNTFLSEVDAAAYDKRGVLEIIRNELTTRVGAALGDIPLKDLLITEFRIK